jgi:hypothetical protein
MPEEVWIALTVGRRVGARIEALAGLKARRVSEHARVHLRGIDRQLIKP